MKSRKKLTDILGVTRKIYLEFRFLGGDEEGDVFPKIVETVNPDIVDINFTGCPVKKVVSKGAGAEF